MHKSAYDFIKRSVSIYVTPGDISVAEVGSYNVNGTIRDIFTGICKSYIGFDLNCGPGVDHVLSGKYDWPEIAEGSYDVVVSVSTMEHVQKPWRWLAEVCRITTHGGLIIISAPAAWPPHYHPIDCFRFLPMGMRGLAEDCGIDTLHCEMTDSYDKDGMRSESMLDMGFVGAKVGRPDNHYNTLSARTLSQE